MKQHTDRPIGRMRDVGVLPYLIWRWRWYRWLLWDSPNIAKLIISGWDKASRQVIYARHEANEPPPPGNRR